MRLGFNGIGKQAPPSSLRDAYNSSTQERTQNPFKGFTVGELAWKSGAGARDMANDGEQLGPEPSNRKDWSGNPTPIRATTRMAPMHTRALVPIGSGQQRIGGIRKSQTLIPVVEPWRANVGTPRMIQKIAHDAPSSSRRQSTRTLLKWRQTSVTTIDDDDDDDDPDPLILPSHGMLGVRPTLPFRRDRIPKTTGATPAQEAEQSTSASAPQTAPSQASSPAPEVVSATDPAPAPAPVPVRARASEIIEQASAPVRQPSKWSLPHQADVNAARWNATFPEKDAMPYGYDDTSTPIGSSKKRPTVNEEDGVGREKKRSRTDAQGTGTSAAVTVTVPVHIPAPRLPELAPVTAAVRTQESTQPPAPLTAPALPRAPHPVPASVPVRAPITAPALPPAKLFVDRSIDAMTPTPGAGTTNLNLRLERIETAQTKMSVLVKASQSAMQTDVTNRLERVESATTSISAGLARIETVEKLDVKVTDVETRLKRVEALLERVEASLEKVLEKIG
ncbi:hypothetical protein EXIGLDRAFT_733659 [Exidia glandulosa HHB12029]|uniref:Uncharacterized protein n=1 Tax=Exidia glandulosa HHB12029 TaxID=1314781 RepID=A0A165B8Z9_EXIGL|nr:hypothetical protein EXIGLDRAFT_733659 [Exidia glandulosa HHB12029]